MTDLFDRDLDSASHPPLEPKPASIGQRREAMLLLMLASVQFTSIVDFMVVMPLGPAVDADPEDQSRPVRPDRLVLHDQRAESPGSWPRRSWTGSAARPRS